MKKHRKRIPIITKKIVLTVSITGFILFATAISASFAHHNKQFKKQFDNDLHEVALAASKCLNPDSFEKYMETFQKDQDYERTYAILKSFISTFNLNVLYVSYVYPPDYTKITYIYNVVSEKSPYLGFEFGHSETYVEKEYNESMKKIFEKGESLVRHTTSKRSGMHITANVPVRDSSGKIVAVLGVQESVEEFARSRRTYFLALISTAFALSILFVILFSLYLDWVFIKPISLITMETDHFASYGGKPSDKLLEVKNEDEIGILAHSLYQMENDVCKNIEELTRVTAEKERISTELNVAAKIQSDMLPKGYPAFPDRDDFDLFAVMDSAKEVGGDLYDYSLLSSNRLMLVVGDVSGKGVPAALFMSKCKTLISILSNFTLSPAEILEETNNQLCKGNETGLFVTCWLGILDLTSYELTFVNAGHPYPVVYQDGQYSFLQTKPNFVLGGMENMRYDEHHLKLSKGSRLFVYTDGVTEATDANEKLFGDERLLAAIQETKDLSVCETVASIRSKIDEFVGKADQFDDITMLDIDLSERKNFLEIDATVQNLDTVLDFIHKQFVSLKLDAKYLMQLDLIVEELFVNIANYAYTPDIGKAKICCEILSENKLKIIFEDSGVKFNPLERENPDVSLGAEERKIGGLGIFLTKKYTSSISYEYKDGKNILTFTK